MILLVLNYKQVILFVLFFEVRKQSWEEYVNSVHARSPNSLL